MFFVDQVFFSLVKYKLVSKIMKNGNRGQAEILWVRLMQAFKTLYFFSPIVFFSAGLRRLWFPAIGRQVRVGARKYAIFTPISPKTQVGIALKRVGLFTERKVDSFSLLLLNFLLGLVFLNRFARSVAFDGANTIYSNDKSGVRNRHLQHYRWP